MDHRRATLIVAAVAILTTGAACGASGDGASTSSATGPRPAAIGDVTVFAAASLTTSFTELRDAFIEQHPDADVTVNFAGSSDLVTQIIAGAPADVFASADVANMDKLADAGGIGADPVTFATNVAEIIVEPGNPRGIGGVADLAGPGAEGLVVVQCAVEVPCGSYAEQVVANAGVTVAPRSFEANVRAVVSKVALGEADAGIVYRTDVIAAAGAADGVAIPATINIVADYPIAVTAEADNPDGARAFVDFVRSPLGQAVLADHGFGSP